MVTPEDVPRILSDAARLLGQGELTVFGSASLAFWLKQAPTSRDLDLWATPEDGADAIEALMGELSWYHDKHGVYVEVCGPETFEAPRSWRDRAKVLTLPGFERVRIVVPHPHDVLIAKLPRFEPSDRDHARCIIAELPIERARLLQLADETPSRALDAPAEMRAAFDANIRLLLDML